MRLSRVANGSLESSSRQRPNGTGLANCYCLSGYVCPCSSQQCALRGGPRRRETQKPVPAEVATVGSRRLTMSPSASHHPATSGPLAGDLQILRAVTVAVSQTLNLNEVIENSLAALTHVTGHEIASLHLLS